jgi:hypothetical protein
MIFMFGYSSTQIICNVGNMARRGLRSTSLSTYKTLDAGDELRKPPKPLLAILRVGNWLFIQYRVIQQYLSK